MNSEWKKWMNVWKGMSFYTKWMSAVLLSNSAVRHLYLWLLCVCVLISDIGLNGPVLVSTAAVRAPQRTGPGSGANTNHSISVCTSARAHAGVCVWDRIECVCALQCPPLNSKGGFTYTPIRAHSHTHSCLGSALSLGGLCCKCLWSKPS